MFIFWYVHTLTQGALDYKTPLKNNIKGCGDAKIKISKIKISKIKISKIKISKIKISKIKISKIKISKFPKLKFKKFLKKFSQKFL